MMCHVVSVETYDVGRVMTKFENNTIIKFENRLQFEYKICHKTLLAHRGPQYCTPSQFPKVLVPVCCTVCSNVLGSTL